MIDRTSFEPLYLQVKRDILTAIADGRIKIGDKLMSENEMLQYYGVGRMTIRSALSELVTEGCLKKEQGLGTFCIAMPKKERRYSIDVLLNTGDTYFIPYVLKGISRVLEKNACNLLLHDTKDSPTHIEKLLDDILNKGTDGVILQPFTCKATPSPEMLAILDRFQRAGIPFITIDGVIDSVDCVCFTVDDFHGGCVAAQHLLDCGHRRIVGLFCESKCDADCRRAGFLKTLNRITDAVAYQIDADQDYADELLQLVANRQVTAIQCYNDLVAVDCLRLMIENGYCVPKDISIIGYDNTDLSLSTIPQLTTLVHPKGRLGSDAAQTMLTLIRGAVVKERHAIYQPELVVRQSVLNGDPEQN